MTITIADVLAEIKRQLDWRGPSGSQQGNIVLSRDQAEYLDRWVITLINERDGLVAAAEGIQGMQRQPAPPSNETQHLGPDFYIEHDRGR